MTLTKTSLTDPARDATRDVLGFVLDAFIDDLHRRDGYRGKRPVGADVRPRTD
jgi:hypothetical protein